jgi:hypothetical protein
MFVWNGSAAVATGPAVAGVGSALGQFLSPTLSTPIVNGVFLQNTPGTYFNISNAPAGTNPFLLVALTGSPNSLAMTAPAASTGGIVGICLASTTPAGTSCGTSGTATIEQSGEVFCLFDGTPAAGDYVQISSTVAGNCHDAGANYPGSGQVLGRVISSAGSNPFLIDLFGPEIQAGGNLVYTAGGTLQAHAHTVVTGVSIPGGGTATINITGAATFGSTSSCVGTDSQGPNPVQVKNFGGPNTIEVIGTIGDSVIVICVGQ